MASPHNPSSSFCGKECPPAAVPIHHVAAPCAVAQNSQPTLPEQGIKAELDYYRQAAQCSVTTTDQLLWQRKQDLHEAFSKETFPGCYDSSLFARYLLERHGYSLHQYMARHLSPAAWNWWFAHVDFLKFCC